MLLRHLFALSLFACCIITANLNMSILWGNNPRALLNRTLFFLAATNMLLLISAPILIKLPYWVRSLGWKWIEEQFTFILHIMCTWLLYTRTTEWNILFSVLEKATSLVLVIILLLLALLRLFISLGLSHIDVCFVYII